MTLRRRAAAVLAALLMALLGLGATAPAARAHAALLSTTPGDAEILEASPEEVTLTFGEPVGLGLGNLRVVTVDGDRVDDGEAFRTDGGKVVHVPVQDDLDEGTYIVLWRVISQDAHPVSGAFTFSVGRATATSKELLGRGNITSIAPDPKTPGIVLGVTRFLGFSALVVLLGGALFALVLWPAGLPRMRGLLLAAAAVEAVAAGAALLLQGPYASGNSLAKVTDTRLLSAVLDSQNGVATAVRTGAAVLAVVAVLVLRGRRGAGVITALGVVCSGAWSAAGHAGVGQWQPFTFVFDVSHLVSVSAWTGGLLVLGLGLRRWWSDAEQSAILPGWSRLATWSVVALVATGTFASFREVGELSALFSTTYGKLLVGKVALVGLMLLFALVGRAYVREHHTARELVAVGADVAPTDEDVAGLRRSTAIEAGLAVVVLGRTALLVNTTPAKAAFAPPYSGQSTAGPLIVQIDVYPARKGLNGIHIYTVGAGSRTVDVAGVSGYAQREDGERVTLDVNRKSLGHYEDLTFVLPGKGEWTIELEVRTSDIDSYVTKQVVEVK